jgi:hypothetical protein
VIQPIVLLASLAGVVLAVVALALDGTGVTGTVGAWLAVIGAGAALTGLVLLATLHLPRPVHWLATILAALAAGLTAVAGWFLMQNALAAVMALVCLGILVVASRPAPNRRTNAP